MSEFVVESDDLSEEETEKLGKALSPLADCPLPLVVELVLVEEEEIRRLNREKRATDRVTDVLSFPAMELERGAPILPEEHEDCLEELEEGTRLYLGSVAVCEKRAREQAEEYGHSFGRELYYLAVHGVLHCLGYDHEEEEERAEMREREEFVMKKLGLAREE